MNPIRRLRRWRRSSICTTVCGTRSRQPKHRESNRPHRRLREQRRQHSERAEHGRHRGIRDLPEPPSSCPPGRPCTRPRIRSRPAAWCSADRCDPRDSPPRRSTAPGRGRHHPVGEARDRLAALGRLEVRGLPPNQPASFAGPRRTGSRSEGGSRPEGRAGRRSSSPARGRHPRGDGRLRVVAEGEGGGRGQRAVAAGGAGRTVGQGSADGSP